MPKSRKVLAEMDPILCLSDLSALLIRIAHTLHLQQVRAIENFVIADADFEVANGLHLWTLSGAISVFSLSVEIQTIRDYLNLLDPDQFYFLMACQAYSSACLFKILEDFLRGRHFPTFPSDSTPFLLNLISSLLQKSLVRVVHPGNISPNEEITTKQFAEGYLTEIRKLLADRFLSSEKGR